MKRMLALTLCLMAMACPAMADEVEEWIAQMTLEQKVAQLFFVRPEDFSRMERVTEGGARLARAFERFPVGGVVLFADNIRSGAQLTALNEQMQTYAARSLGIGLLIGVDEEGGSVSRVARKLRLDALQPAMSEVGATGDPDRAREAGERIGAYLSGYGFTLDFAPVADVRTDVANAEITARSFGYDAARVSAMVAAFVEGLQAQGVRAVLKHFPGHGAVSGNTHNAGASSARTLTDWRACEWLPFQAGISAGAEVVMVSHQTAIAVDAATPASLSRRVVTELLRGELGFDGVVITDALRMEAVAGEYGSGEACVRALEAGCDMLLLPKNFSNGYNGVLEALSEGRLNEARVDESVARILRLKQRMGLLTGKCDAGTDPPAAEGAPDEWAVVE